jgi:hypothetical protein
MALVKAQALPIKGDAFPLPNCEISAMRHRAIPKVFAAILIVGTICMALGPIQFLPSLDKAQHSVAFIAITLAVRIAWLRVHWLLLLLLMATLGGAIEIGQGMVTSVHKPDPWDWLVDCAASAAVLGVAGVIAIRSNSRQR